MNSKSIKIPSKKTLGDLTIIFITAVLSFILASLLDTFEFMIRWSSRQVWQLNELFILLVIMASVFTILCLFGVFSMRRWLQLQQELTRRKQAEEDLQKAHAELERRVEERTLELSRANDQLKEEIAARKRAEDEIRAMNQALEQRVLDRTHKLAALYEVTTIANQSLGLKLTLKLSLERLLRTMRITAGLIHLFDESEGTLYLATAHGIPPGEMTHFGSVNNGLVDAVINQNRPLFIIDLKTASELPQPIQAADFQTYIGVPIRARGQAIGVLSILEKQKQQFFDEGSVALLTSIADQLGLAIENARLQKQAQQAAIMSERGRLARELHDAVTQSLYSLTLFAEAGHELAEAGNGEAVKHNFKRIGETALQALKEMRLLVHELRPQALEHGGLIDALRQRLNAVESRVQVKARLIAEDLVELPARVEEGLYRIAQEALNNTLKHAAATSVTVYLRLKDKQVELEVVDNGRGFDPEAARQAGGMGLANMHERAKKLGGILEIFSQPGKGASLKVSLRIEDQFQPTFPKAGI